MLVKGQVWCCAILAGLTIWQVGSPLEDSWKQKLFLTHRNHPEDPLALCWLHWTCNICHKSSIYINDQLIYVQKRQKLNKHGLTRCFLDTSVFLSGVTKTFLSTRLWISAWGHRCSPQGCHSPLFTIFCVVFISRQHTRQRARCSWQQSSGSQGFLPGGIFRRPWNLQQVPWRQRKTARERIWTGSQLGVTCSQSSGH